MKTSIFVISALFAPSGAVKIINKFMPEENVKETDFSDSVNLQLNASVNVRSELQQQLRAYLYGPPLPTEIPGTSNKTSWNFGREARQTELRFGQPRYPVQFPWPNWIVPGSEAIMPKKSAPIDYLDDEVDKEAHYHWMANYNPERELNVQLDGPTDTDALMTEVDVQAEQRKKTRAELQKKLRAYLGRDYKYPYDKFPATVLPGSEPIMPKKSAAFDLFDGGMTDDWHHNHRSAYNPRTHKYDNFVQIEAQDDGEITVAEARVEAAQMQAQMDKAVADADAKRAVQQAQYENNISNNDPAAQLQGLMNAQQSLHRLTSAFSAKPNMDKVNSMAQKLGIPMTPELMQLGTNEAISNALVEIAVGMGKSEGEIEKALD